MLSSTWCPYKRVPILTTGWILQPGTPSTWLRGLLYCEGRHIRKKLALNLGRVEVDGDKSYLSLFLALLDAASPLPLHIEVVLESSILDENYSQRMMHRFQQSKSEECCPYLISLETLKCPSSVFLVAEIIDVLIHLEEDVFLSPKPDNSSLAHTWKIDGFSKLTKQIYLSGPFLYNDHIWYLRLDRCSKGEDKSISLFLTLDDASTLGLSVKIHAEYYIDWVDQIKGKNHQRKGTNMFSEVQLFYFGV
ncbi:hypothetical protein Taro_011807 [Colocasia esculenta]|uniref:MATH domain-containing protein n=1 Tax=Colocasia esculenta TaxID=4460 RepID=A0A843U2E7_COLES|nr:hypothetical protein [Colocasia esculenta]